MKKNKTKWLPIALIALLAGCGRTGTSSSVSDKDSSVPSSISETSSGMESSEIITSYAPDISEDVFTLQDAVSLLHSASENEVLSSNGANYTRTTSSGSIKDVETEEIQIHDDQSSTSNGTVTESENNTVTKSDTYSTLKERVIDKIQNGDNILDYPMFVSIKEYSQKAFSKSAYQDKVNKKYIVASEAEANQGGLTDSDLYITEARYPYETSGLCAENVSLFIQTNFIANIYSNVTKMDVTENEDLTNTYSASLSYSYDGDLNDVITETYQVSFTMDKENRKLLSSHYLSTHKDVSNSDSTDVYETGTDVNLTVSYGDRTKQTTSLNPDDYFLATLNDIAITRSPDITSTPLNPDEIPSDISYLFARASSYTPSKAVDVSMMPSSSSDENVVKITNGSMEVINTGTTTLSFTYYGRDEGVYKEMTFEKTISIVTPKPTSVYVFSPTPSVQNNTLQEGLEYDYDYTVTPSKADQSVIVTSSDPTVIEASLVGAKVHLKALKAGTASVTVTSASNSAAFYTLNLTVQSSNIDFATYITTKTYVATTSYGYRFSMTFNADGTGKRIQTITSSGATYDDPFTYTLNHNVITFHFSTSFKPFINGTITNNGDSIKCECGEDGGYSSFNFNAQ